jgi:hypothetical protein
MTYRNPFTLLGLNSSELSDETQLKRAKQRLLAEASLSADGVYAKGKIILNGYEIEQLFSELSQSENLAFYNAVAQCRDLDAFLSGSKSYKLINILDDNIWETKDGVGEQALQSFAFEYSQRLKNAVISNQHEDLKNLTNADLEEWGFVDEEAFYAPTMQYLDGILSELHISARQSSFLDHNEAKLWEYTYANFSPDTLNLLPDEFYRYRDDFAVALIRAARKSFIHANHFYKVAQKICFKFKLTERGRKRLQTEMAEIEKLEQEQADKDTRRAKQQEQDNQSSNMSLWGYLRIAFFVVFFLSKFVQFCGTSSTSSSYNIPKSVQSHEQLESINKIIREQRLKDLENSTHLPEVSVSSNPTLNEKTQNPISLSTKCYKLPDMSKIGIERLIPISVSNRIFVIYVMSNLEGSNNKVFSTHVKNGLSDCTLIFPYPISVNSKICVAVGDNWSNESKSPCNAPGFLKGNVQYYTNVKVKMHLYPASAATLGDTEKMSLEKMIREEVAVSKKEFFKAVSQ